jgi:hypothetical protein
VASCEACGTQCPAGAAYCGVCGHRLGEQPAEPVTVNVRLVDSPRRGCVSCFTAAVGVVAVLFLILWIFSC